MIKNRRKNKITKNARIMIGAFLLIALILCSVGCETRGKDVLLTVNGREIGYGIYRYFFLCAAEDGMHANGGYYEEHPEEYEADVKQTALDSLKDFCAAYDIADELGVSLDETDRAIYDMNIAQYIEMYDSDGFEQMLKDLYFGSEEVYSEYEMNRILIEKICSKLRCRYSDDEFAALSADYCTENYYRVKIIMFSKDSIYAAETADAFLKDGADFDSIYEEYSEYDYYNDILCNAGNLRDNVAREIEKLADGEHSGLISDEDYYLIIKRLAIDGDTLEEYEQVVETDFLFDEYGRLVDEKTPAYKVVYGKSYDGIGIDTVK